MSVKVFMLGLENSGKTSLLYTAVARRFSKDPAWTGNRGYLLQPTVGFNVEQVCHYSLKGVAAVELWDFGSFKNITYGIEALHKGSSVAFVVDATTCDSNLERNKAFFASVYAKCVELNLPLCVFANKMDLPDARCGTWISRSLMSLDACNKSASFRAEARLLLLVSRRRGCPKEIRQKLLHELVLLQPAPEVFEMCAPEVRDSHASGVDNRVAIFKGLQWLIDEIKKR